MKYLGYGRSLPYDIKLEHAEFGTKVLFQNNLIRKFIDDDKYDEIISKAIYNHNKYKIQEGLSEIELLQCKIIRDADKLDNFRVKEKDNFKVLIIKNVLKLNLRAKMHLMCLMVGDEDRQLSLKEMKKIILKAEEKNNKLEEKPSDITLEDIDEETLKNL